MSRLERTLQAHLAAIAAQEDVPVRRSAMVLCALATSFPLYFGFFRHDLSIGAIYGALTGYFLTLNDHQGTLPHRLWVSTLTFVMLCLGFLGGIFLQRSTVEFFLVFGFLTYWIGLMGGDGAEFEKAILFSTIQVVVSAESKYLTYAAAPVVFTYAFIAYGFVLVVTTLHATLSQRPRNPHTKLLEAFTLPLKSQLERHLHAMSYMSIALLTAVWVYYSQSERGYWAIVTVLIVMKPDRKLSLYRALQRLIGTAAAVLVCDGMIYLNHSALLILILISVASFFIPWALKKNYAAASFLITAVVVLLLDLPTVHIMDLQTPLRRLETTGIGCLFGAAGVFLSKALSLFVRRRATTLPSK